MLEIYALVKGKGGNLGVLVPFLFLFLFLCFSR
jgi:hypothetical protein